MGVHLTATERHLSYAITQCYLLLVLFVTFQ